MPKMTEIDFLQALTGDEFPGCDGERAITLLTNAVNLNKIELLSADTEIDGVQYIAVAFRLKQSEFPGTNPGAITPLGLFPVDGSDWDAFSLADPAAFAPVIIVAKERA